jgi:5-methylcytosine-specific restriction endonuclease McrA
LTGDHIVPRIYGGADLRENMRAAHRSCNSRRGAGEGGYVGIEGNPGRSLTPPSRAEVDEDEIERLAAIARDVQK